MVPIAIEEPEPEPLATSLPTNDETANQPPGSSKALDPNDPAQWELEQLKAEESLYQGYVERLQEKAEKEASRVLRVGLGFISQSGICCS